MLGTINTPKYHLQPPALVHSMAQAGCLRQQILSQVGAILIPNTDGIENAGRIYAALGAVIAVAPSWLNGTINYNGSYTNIVSAVVGVYDPKKSSWYSVNTPISHVRMGSHTDGKPW